MDEYISREEAINAIKSLESSMPAKDNYAKGYDAALGRVLIAVREVSPVTDVKPVKYSSWEYRTYPIVDRDGVARRCMRGYVCKACGHGEPEEKRFCGGCGAEMRNE